MNFDPLNAVLIGVILLLAVGFYGLLITRNLIKIVLVLQVLVKAVVIALVESTNFPSASTLRTT